jgi:hypothetical protein
MLTLHGTQDSTRDRHRLRRVRSETDNCLKRSRPRASTPGDQQDAGTSVKFRGNVDATPRTRRRPIPTHSSIAKAMARRCHTWGHVLLDNRQGLVADVCATAATGTADARLRRCLRTLPFPRAARSAPTRASTRGRSCRNCGRSTGCRSVETLLSSGDAQAKCLPKSTRPSTHQYYMRRLRRRLRRQLTRWQQTVGGNRCQRRAAV